MSLTLKWETGTPVSAGLYFVAIRLGPVAGFFDVVAWNGAEWSFHQPDDIVAFIEFSAFKSQLDIEWPEPEPVLGAVPPLPEHDAGWREVNGE